MWDTFTVDDSCQPVAKPRDSFSYEEATGLRKKRSTSNLLQLEIEKLKEGESPRVREKKKIILSRTPHYFRIGAKFSEEFEVGPVIGRGRFSSVREVKCKTVTSSLRYGDNICIKQIDKDEMDDLYCALLRRELDVLRMLEHPCIISHKSAYEDDKYVFILMEMAGSDLFSAVQEKFFFPEKEGKEVFAEILSGVKYLHDNNIVHLDLKLENILLSKTGHVKICDFGFAINLDDILYSKRIPDLPYGSPQYSAPELLCSRSVSKKADMFSVGVILYILLSGRDVFNSEDNQIRVQYSFSDPVWSTVSDSAKDLISNLLHKRPEDRFSVDQVFEHPWLKDHKTMQIWLYRVVLNVWYLLLGTIQMFFRLYQARHLLHPNNSHLK